MIQILFFLEILGFNDRKNIVTTDAVELRRKPSLSITELKSVYTELKQVIDKFAAARKCAKKSNRSSVSEVGFDQLFDLSKCRCEILDTCNIKNGKVMCKCDFDHRTLVDKNIVFKRLKVR